VEKCLECARYEMEIENLEQGIRFARADVTGGQDPKVPQKLRPTSDGELARSLAAGALGFLPNQQPRICSSLFDFPSFGNKTGHNSSASASLPACLIQTQASRRYSSNNGGSIGLGNVQRELRCRFMKWSDCSPPPTQSSTVKRLLRRSAFRATEQCLSSPTTESHSMTSA
jgi:hypothetical protein